jgi:hypothetical protein
MIAEYPKITLPLRPHLGCDPLCEECREWQDELLEAMRPTLDEAKLAFLDVITTRFPELNKMSQHGASEFNDASEEFARDIAEASLEDIVRPSESSQGQLDFGAEVVEMRRRSG